MSFALLQVAYGWVIKSALDGTPKATATGNQTTVLLPPGIYVATLNVVDDSGTSATAGPNQFNVTGDSQAGTGPAGIGPYAVMAAVIKSPTPVVPQAANGINQSVPLDATGSTASPGHLIRRYIWTVTTEQAGNRAVLFNQTLREPTGASVLLPVGSYIVSLVVIDTSGRNSSIIQVCGV